MFNKLKSIEKKISPNWRKVIHNIGWLSIERMVDLLLSFFVGIQVIRYLGPEDFGKLSYAFSFVVVFTAVSQLGLDAIVVRDLVKREKLTNNILGTAFFLKLIGSVIAVGLIAIAIWAATKDIQSRWITLIIALGLIFSSFDAIDLWFQSKVFSKDMAIVRSSQFLFNSIAKLLFIAYQLPLMAFAYLVLISSIFRALGSLFVYSKNKQSIWRWKFNQSLAKTLLKDSFPLVFSGVMTSIYMKIDQVMLGNMSSGIELGNYAAAVRFSELWYFIPMAICVTVFPGIIRSKQRSQKEYYANLQQLYDLMVWLSLMIAIPMTFCSTFLLTTLLGAEYSSAGEILSLHIWSGLFIFLSVARSQWLIAENLTKLSFITQLLGALVNIGLNLIFIPQYGGIGAAWATIISYAISSYLSCLFFPVMFQTGWMLTKAILVPLRFKQNTMYIQYFLKKISK